MYDITCWNYDTVSRTAPWRLRGASRPCRRAVPARSAGEGPAPAGLPLPSLAEAPSLVAAIRPGRARLHEL